MGNRAGDSGTTQAAHHNPDAAGIVPYNRAPTVTGNVAANVCPKGWTMWRTPPPTGTDDESHAENMGDKFKCGTVTLLLILSSSDSLQFPARVDSR